MKSSAGWQGIDDKVITVVFLKGGTEFTAIVVDVGTANNSDLVLLPTKVWYIYCFSHNVIICLPGHSTKSLSYTFPTFSSCWILIVKHYWAHVSWCSSPTKVALGIQVYACRFSLCFILQDTGSSRKLNLQLEMEHENTACTGQV